MKYLRSTNRSMPSTFIHQRKYWNQSLVVEENLWQDFRTGPYFIMHTLLCFKKTIAIIIDVFWNCGALFFLLRGFFSKSK